MGSKISIDILDVAEDTFTVLGDIASDENICDILSIAEDTVPGLRLILKSYNTISDRILRRKFEKFIAYANEGKTDYSFENFKKDIVDNEQYRNEITEYITFKINKFDTDFKIKILSKASLDFFGGIINYDGFIDLSECLDMISRKDIIFMEYLIKTSKANGVVFTPGTCYAKGLIIPEINSIIKKLNTISILEECDDIIYETVSSDPSDHPSQHSSLTKSYIVSDLGRLLAKYLS